MKLNPSRIQSVEDAIYLTLKENTFEDLDDIRELIRFLFNEDVNSNKSNVIGSTVVLGTKDLFIKLLRSNSKGDINFTVHKQVRLSKEALRYIQTHIPSPLVFKADRLYFNRTVVDRVSTVIVATDQYVYKRVRNGVRHRDAVTVDASRLSAKHLLAILDTVDEKGHDDVRDRYGNYIGLQLHDESSKHTLDLNIHGTNGEYHSGLAVPSRILDTARLLFAGVEK